MTDSSAGVHEPNVKQAQLTVSHLYTLRVRLQALDRPVVSSDVTGIFYELIDHLTVTDPGRPLQGLTPSVTTERSEPSVIMSDNKRLAFSIIRFLHDQLRSGTMSSGAQESLEGESTSEVSSSDDVMT